MEPPPTVPPFPNYRLDGSAAQDKVPYDAPLQRYGQELRPHHRSHIQYLRSIWALYSAVYVNLRRGKWLRSWDAFFVNTTEGLIVIAIKLCQEGNTEPLIQRTRRIV